MPPTDCERAGKTGDPLGCTYLAFSPEFGDLSANYGCLAVFVSNPGKTPAALQVKWKGVLVDVEKHGRLVTNAGLPISYQPIPGSVVPPGASAIVALVQGVENPFIPALTCPFPAALKGDFAVRQEQRGTAFRIDASEPVFVSSVLPYGAGLDNAVDTGISFRAESSWDYRYLDVGTFKPGRPDRYDGGVDGTTYWWSLPSVSNYTALASTRAVSVRVRREAGVVTYKLAPNEVLSLSQDDRFIGSLIESDDLLAVGTGAPFLRVPFDAPFFSAGQVSFHWMSPPSSWGSEVAAVRYPRRYEAIDEPGVWRILGGANDTVLSYDPAPPPGAPLTLAQGEQVVFQAPGPFVVRAQDEQHPFHVSLLMTTYTATCTGTGTECDQDRRGNSELVAVLPPQEYAHRFAFFTEPSHSQTWLVVTRRKDGGGVFHDVNLDCAGTLGDWKPVGSGALYEYTYVALSRGDFAPQVYSGGTCTLGPHTLESDGAVGLTLWGWGSSTATDAESAGANSYAINIFGLGPRPEKPIVPPH